MTAIPHDAPRIPITGAAALAIHAALKSMALFAGAMSVTIEKQRTAGGGYVYAVDVRKPAT